MNIGEVGRQCQLPAKTIRYYEDIGLIRPGREDNGYRYFTEADVHRLRFVQRARSLGFTVADCRGLLSLYENKNRSSADVKTIASDHLNQIGMKIAELQSLSKTLSDLIEHCHGDHRPECPILDDLAGTVEARLQ